MIVLPLALFGAGFGFLVCYGAARGQNAILHPFRTFWNVTLIAPIVALISGYLLSIALVGFEYMHPTFRDWGTEATPGFDYSQIPDEIKAKIPEDQYNWVASSNSLAKVEAKLAWVTGEGTAFIQGALTPWFGEPLSREVWSPTLLASSFLLAFMILGAATALEWQKWRRSNRAETMSKGLGRQCFLTLSCLVCWLSPLISALILLIASKLDNYGNTPSTGEIIAAYLSPYLLAIPILPLQGVTLLILAIVPGAVAHRLDIANRTTEVLLAEGMDLAAKSRKAKKSVRRWYQDRVAAAEARRQSGDAAE